MVGARRFRVAGLLAAFALLAVPATAYASHDQAALFDAGPALVEQPVQTLQTLRSLGVRIIRVGMGWGSVAPVPNWPIRPLLFDASDPRDYPQANWRPYDTVVNEAARYGITVELMVTGAAPLWATSGGAPKGYQAVWNPSPTEFGQFVQAVATRYSNVHMWEFWNEPNWGAELAPQVGPSSPAILSAGNYRLLFNEAWRALQRAGHGGDTVMTGGVAPFGTPTPTATDFIEPLAFIRTLYCVDGSDRELAGSAAHAVGCPGAGSRRQFAARYPALFRLSGFGVHPYSGGAPPIIAPYGDPAALDFHDLPRLVQLLHRVAALYQSGVPTRMYNTEYGYETAPPQHTSWWNTTLPTQAAYMNWAEFLSWKNPLIRTYAQYELRDDWFATGLMFADGQPKPSFYAYLLPLYLPTNTTGRSHRLEVWGGVRPAANAKLDTGRPQSALIQFQRRPGGPFRTIKRAQITNYSGYFDVRVKFPASGAIRLAWAYPAGDQRLENPVNPRQLWVYSRVVKVRIRRG